MFYLYRIDQLYLLVHRMYLLYLYRKDQLFLLVPYDVKFIFCTCTLNDKFSAMIIVLKLVFNIGRTQ